VKKGEWVVERRETCKESTEAHFFTKLKGEKNALGGGRRLQEKDRNMLISKGERMTKKEEKKVAGARRNKKKKKIRILFDQEKGHRLHP